jgi:hypothetical protein
VPSLDDLYRKFGETAEAAQLLETELGTVLLREKVIREDLIEKKDPARAADILSRVNRNTLGQLLNNLRNQTTSLDSLDDLLSKALHERNRLFHSFYRQHNFRRFSTEGITLMLEDLEKIHSVIFDAYKAVLILEGVDLDAAAKAELPTRHVPI